MKEHQTEASNKRRKGGKKDQVKQTMEVEEELKDIIK